jgi:hypothetical protein
MLATLFFGATCMFFGIMIGGLMERGEEDGN